jgi:Na+/H+ antiporter NhaC
MMHRFRAAGLLVLLVLLAGGSAVAQDAALPAPPELHPPRLQAPNAVLDALPFQLTITLPEGASASEYTVRTAQGAELARGTAQAGATAVEGLKVGSRADLPLAVTTDGGTAEASPRFLPGWLSILPPLLAIALALLLREVVISLFTGVWLGALIWTGFDPFSATLRVIDRFALTQMADTDHTAIIIFSLLIGGMVGVMGRNGGTYGIVERLAPLATTPRRGQLAAYAQGLAIFFDDYANTLIVGNTMRPVTDRLRVSREKLAYIVDSTSAPVASIVFVSTWVGYEISLIADGLKSAAATVAPQHPELAAKLAETSAFNVFIDTIPYRFYPLLALVMVLLVIVMKRDIGPMHRAEVRAREGRGIYREGASLLTDTSGGHMEPPAGAPLRWINAALPVLVVVVTVLLGLYFSGRAELGGGAHPLRDVYGAANSFHVLLWASLFGSATAILLTISQRILTMAETMEAWLSGIRSMVLAMIILVLAWSLGAVTEVLGTAQYISSALEGNLPVHLLPVVVFIIAAAISFATGTSWGTMAILLPLVIPLAATLTVSSLLEMQGHYTILLGVTSSVLAGSIFGDHCSPISDTTVMSSMASACDHMDHVRTQMPYALLVAFVGMLLGDIPTAYGLSPWVSLVAATGVLWAVLRIWGKKTEGDDVERLTPAQARAVAHEAV